MPDNIPAAEPAPTAETHALPTPYDGNQATPDEFGAGVATQGQKVGELDDHIATVARTRANEIGVQGLEAQGRASLNRWILDSKTGFTSLRGADAMARRDEYLGKFQKEIDDITAKAPNDDQRRMFGQQAAALKQQGLTHAFTHETHEQNGYAAALVKGNLDQTMIALQNVIGAPNAAADPALLQRGIDDRVAEVYKAGIDAARTKYGEGASSAAIQSIVQPELQRLAISGMETATSTQNPAIARVAYDKLGKYLVTAHQRQYGAVVQALESRQAVTKAADEVFAKAATGVLVPGAGPGDPPMAIARVDAAKVAAALAEIPADNPRLADIQKGVEQRQNRLDDVWKKTAAAVQDRVYSAGQDPVTGAFDIESRAINPADKVWLQQHAPALLTKLRDQDQKVQRQGSAEENRQAIEMSRSNFGTATSWLYDERNKDDVLKMTRAQFASSLTDDTQYPGGFRQAERGKALAEFDKQQKILTGKLDEAVGKTIKESIKRAFPEVSDAMEAKELENRYFGRLLDKANAFAKEHKGAVDTEKLRAFVEKELVEGTVDDTGLFGSNFGRDKVRLIEAQTDRQYRGKTFRDPTTGEQVVIGADEQPGPVTFPRAPPPAPGSTITAAGPPAATPRVATAADYAALPPGTTYIDPNGKTKRKP